MTLRKSTCSSEHTPKEASEFMANWFASSCDHCRQMSSSSENSFRAVNKSAPASHFSILHEAFMPRSKQRLHGITSRQRIAPLDTAATQRTPMYHPSYSIGDTGKSRDMIIDNPESSKQNIAALRIHACAFVRRSNGKWTYAILADKPDEDNARFLVQKKGSTKLFTRDEWSKHVRLIKFPLAEKSHSTSVDSISSDE